MSWISFLPSEYDTNSPVSRTIMRKIINNLEALALDYMCGFGDSVNSALIDDNYTLVKTLRIFIPSWAKKVDVYVDCYLPVNAGNILVDINGVTDYETITYHGGYIWTNALVITPGIDGWYNMEIKMKYNSVYSHLAYVRGVVVKVNSLLP